MRLGAEARAVLWDCALNLRDLTLTQGYGLRTELNRRTPSWCHSFWGEETHTSGVGSEVLIIQGKQGFSCLQIHSFTRGLRLQLWNSGRTK